MAPASVQVVCMEPVVFLRGQSAVGEDARGRRRQIDFDAPPSQLRGLVTLTLPRPSRIKEISITLQGKARTDWPEGIGPNRLDTVEESIIFKQKVTLYSAREQAPTRRPRASSVGPGIDWMKDDLVWPTQATSNNVSAEGSNSAGPSTPHSSNIHQPLSASSASTSPSASFSAALGLLEGRRSPKLPRSLGKNAVKASASMLLPNNANGNGSVKRSSTPQISRPSSSSSSHSATHTPSPPITRSPLTTSHPGDGYFDPPPGYVNDSVGGNELTASSQAPSAPHPQSVSAAGPGQRSILHSSATRSSLLPEQRARARGESPTSGSVRFDPQGLSSALERQQLGADGTSPPSELQPACTSEPTSRRTSTDQSLLRPIAQSPMQSKTDAHGSNHKGKGKASSSSTTPPIPAAARRGIKTLLGGLRKDDESDHHHKTNRSSNTSTSFNPSFSHNNTHSSTSSSPLAFIDGEQIDWREFPKGTHSYPFSIPLPSNLPPTLHADFGSNAYTIRAHVHRAGPLTANLSAETEVTLVHAPDEGGQDDIESIVVERNWEDALRYMVVVMGKSFPVGGKVPIWAKFVPMEKVRIHRILGSLEERTAYYAKGRRVARHEVPRRWTLLKVLPPDAKAAGGKHLGILPILSDDPNALLQSPLAPMARAAAVSYGDALSDDAQRQEVEATALASLADPTGPWEITMELEVPQCTSTPLNISSNHVKSNIAVHHIVKLAIRVERLDGYKGVDPALVPDDKRKLYDILIEAPIAINHSHTANAWLTLPDYWSVSAPESAAEQGDSVIAYSNATSNSATAMQESSSTASSLRRKADIGATLTRKVSPESGRKSKSVAPPFLRGGGGQGASSSPSTREYMSDNSSSYGKEARQLEARNARLAQISKRWLSLTGAAFGAGGGGSGSSGSSTSNGQNAPSSSTTAPQSYQATVTYAGNFDGMRDGDEEESAGLPTYDMIDRERGTVDPPPDQQGRRTK